jgi:sialate O-acetylesterase
MTIAGKEETIRLTDIAVGEVWLAGGQSNMEFHMRYEKHVTEVKKKCTNPRIRFYDVPEIAFDEQEQAFDYSRMGIWRKATQEDLDYFSAVGYYFQQSLEADLNVPVGIIGCNWGGTVSVSWMNPETVKKVGTAWQDEYEAFAAQVNWKEYWNKQQSDNANDRGNPFADPFGEFLMPKTPTKKELRDFFASITDMEYSNDFKPQHFPGSLYEHMLKKIAPYGIRGVLWYQGESEDEKYHAELYQQMLMALIGDWRDLWEDQTLPFLIVQLPGYESWLDNQNMHYDQIRRAQELVTKIVPNTWLCSISDIGEQYDIHPKNKQPAGERLALLARGHVYGEEIFCDAPEALRMQKSGNQITILFRNAEGGLELRGDKVNALKVYSGSNEISWQAKIKGNKLILTLQQEVTGMLQIEFAQEKFYQVNIYNKAGIPAIPFSLYCLV